MDGTTKMKDPSTPHVSRGQPGKRVALYSEILMKGLSSHMGSPQSAPSSGKSRRGPKSVKLGPERDKSTHTKKASGKSDGGYQEPPTSKSYRETEQDFEWDQAESDVADYGECWEQDEMTPETESEGEVESDLEDFWIEDPEDKEIKWKRLRRRRRSHIEKWKISRKLAFSRRRKWVPAKLGLRHGLGEIKVVGRVRTS